METGLVLCWTKSQLPAEKLRETLKGREHDSQSPKDPREPHILTSWRLSWVSAD